MLKRLSKERQCRVDINDSHEKADDTLLDRCVLSIYLLLHLKKNVPSNTSLLFLQGCKPVRLRVNIQEVYSASLSFKLLTSRWCGYLLIYSPHPLLPPFADRHSCPLPRANHQCLDYTGTTCCPHVALRHAQCSLGLDSCGTFSRALRFVLWTSQATRSPSSLSWSSR